MEYLNIVYSSERVRPGADVEVRWDVKTPDLKEWMSLRDFDIYLDALNLIGVGSGMGSFPISVGSAHVSAFAGSLTFMLPETVPPGNYELTFSLTIASKASERSDIYAPQSPLAIVVSDSGGGDTHKRPRVDSVDPERYSIAQLRARKAARFELHGENLDLISTKIGMLTGRATSNYGIMLYVFERGPDLIKLGGSIKPRQFTWLKPGPAHIVLKSDQGQLNVQVYIY